MSHNNPNYSAGNDRFNEEAASYDQKHGADKAALLCANSLAQRLPELQNGTSKSQNWSAIEVGAGTGLLSLCLLRYFSFVLGVDPSEGMLAEFEKKSRKAKEQGAGEMKGAKTLLESADDPALEGRKFNLAVSHLVFHHIPDMKRTIETMARVLAPGGYLAVSDFIDDEHGIRGKGIADGVHRNGLIPEELKRMFEEVGLQDVKVEKSFDFEMQLGDHSHGHGNGHGQGHAHDERSQHDQGHHHAHSGEAASTKGDGQKKKQKMNFMLITGRKT